MTMITPSYLGETIEYSSLHACRSTLEDPTLAIFCVVAADRQGFRGVVADQADHASALDRRREVAGETAGAADEAGGYGCNGGRATGHRPLDPGRAAEGNDRRASEVSLARVWESGRHTGKKIERTARPWGARP